MGVGFASPLRELEALDEEFGDVLKMSSIRNDEDDPVGEVLVCEGAASGGEMEGCIWGPYSDVIALTKAECWGFGWIIVEPQKFTVVSSLSAFIHKKLSSLFNSFVVQ